MRNDFAGAPVSDEKIEAYFSSNSCHGIKKIEQEVSSYYLADEIRGTYRGMMIAIPPKEWKIFTKMNLVELTNILRYLAAHVNLVVFASHPRAPKKTRGTLKRTRPSKRPHLSK